MCRIGSDAHPLRVGGGELLPGVEGLLHLLVLVDGVVDDLVALQHAAGGGVEELMSARVS